MKDKLIGVALLISLAVLIKGSYAGSATWNANPVDASWLNSSNWTPQTIPNGPADVATFDLSSQTSISLFGNTEVSSIVFNPSASAFTFQDGSYGTFAVSGDGIINNSGITQSFILYGVDYGGGTHTSMLAFKGTATAGNLTEITANGGANGEQFDSLVAFFEHSNAGSSIITVYGSGAGFARGGLTFYGSSSALSATINVYSSDCCGGLASFTETSSAANATIFNQLGGSTIFWDSSDAANSTITCNGDAHVTFADNSTAGNAVITLNGASAETDAGDRLTMTSEASLGNATIIGNGSSFGEGAYLSLSGDGGMARMEIFGNAILHLEFHAAPGSTIGSLEGDGLVYLGTNNLTIGSNNLSTTFSGVIQDEGSVTKIGTGNLTLTNANTYTGGTVISGGILLANNSVRSATGAGPVQTNAGTVGGSGAISGAVTVGTGGGPGAFLAPGARGVTPGTLTIRKKLTLKADATYKVTLDSGVSTADAVRAKGIRIQGASILFNDLETNVLPPGTVFVIINNTASSPISGTFGNLADGSTVTIGSNTYQANYEGGDGNDLTLTVVP